MAETGRKPRLPELGRRGFISKARDAKEGSPLKQSSPGGSPKRPNSPEPNCSICLGGIEDQSFANKCFHSFCKTCLFEWSKVKPECPVCRQGFDSIIFNVKAMDDYEEYNIPRPLSPRSLWSVSALLGEVGNQWEVPDLGHSISILRHRVIDSLDLYDRNRRVIDHSRAPRRYLTHLSSRYSINREDPSNSTSSNNVSGNPTIERPPPRAHESSRNSAYPFNFAAYLRDNFDSISTISSITRPPPVGTCDHRRYIYENDLWVQPVTTRLARECTATFYRSNPAVTHRLLPFLNRELLAILRGSDPDSTHSSAEALLSRIKAAIFEYDIPSLRFRQVIEPYIRDRTHHFLHELYYFAKSPYTIEDYNQHAIYVPKTHVKQLKLEQPPSRPLLFFNQPEVDSSTDDSVIEVVDSDQGPSSIRDKNRMQLIAPSSSSSSLSSASAATATAPDPTTSSSILTEPSRRLKESVKQTAAAASVVQQKKREETTFLPLTNDFPSTVSQNINVIEDFDNPRPGPSGLCRNNDFKTSTRKLRIEDDGSESEVDVDNVKPSSNRNINYDSESADSDSSIKVVGFKKPLRERTPEVITVSSCGELAEDNERSESESEDGQGPEKKRLRIFIESEKPKSTSTGPLAWQRLKSELIRARSTNNDEEKITDSEGSDNEKEKVNKKKQKKRRRTKSSHSKRRKDSSSSRHVDIEGNTTQTDLTSSSENESSAPPRASQEAFRILRRIPSVIVRPPTLKNINVTPIRPVIRPVFTQASSPTSSLFMNGNGVTPPVAKHSVIATLCSSIKKKPDSSDSDSDCEDGKAANNLDKILKAFD